MKKNNYLKGFTLIELLIVISIIGLVVVISAFGLTGARESTRDAKRKADIEQIRAAMELYKADFGSYPAFSTGAACPPGGIGWDNVDTVCSFTSTYLQNIPMDPNWPYTGGRCTNYLVSSDFNTYSVFAVLEASAEMTAVKPAPKAIVGSACGGGCVTFTPSSGTCGGRSFNYWQNNP